MNLELIQKALSFKWEKSKLLDAVTFCKEHKLDFTSVHEEMIVLDNRWVVYKKEDFTYLNKAIAAKDEDWKLMHYVWADGSGTTFDNIAGIGVVVEIPDWWAGWETIEISENIGFGTNNVAELSAIWKGLRVIPDLTRVITVRSDSQYAMGVLMNLGWSLTKNVDLINNIRVDLSYRKVTFEHVKGHSGIKQNERCDELANQGRKGK